ncbi:MAG: roadblock/LC7 domain-containing protein [Deinococcaceae bacterium]
MDINDILKEISAIKGITATALVSGEGFVVDSVVNDGYSVDLDFLGGVVSSAIGTGQGIIETLGRGKLAHIMLEFTEGPLLMSAVDGFTLVSALDSSQNLGRVRFQLKKHLVQLSSALKA